MEIYLIRHTTLNIESGICYGQSNIDVSDNFKKEVLAIKQKLPKNKKIKLYASPLLRCYKLASEISKTVFLDSRLKELNFGTWENKPWNSIPRSETDPWMANFVFEKPPNGESYLELQNRMIDFYSMLKKNYTQNESIIIVSHAGPIRALLSYLREIDLKDSFNIKIDYGQIFKISH